MTNPPSTPYTKSGRQVFKAKKRIEKAIEKEYQKIQSEDPVFARTIKMVTSVRGFKKKPEGFSNVSHAVFARLILPKGLSKTQAEITKEVIKIFPPEFKITPSIWQRKLPPYEKVTIDKTASEFYPEISLRGCKTLSEIRKRVIEYKAKGSSNIKLKAEIIIDKNNVIVTGQQTYKIENRKSGKYDYPSIRVEVDSKRVWLRVDTLKAMLS